jgi:alkanesulfonate monooxygenase SsuD/methylene tetrahydromethanopterin reductase-like flavin-dependent oxidoreductase (luciferase family)
VVELRRLWAGEPPFERADPVGPTPAQEVVPLLAGAMGPKALARAATWADGVSGFSINGDLDDIEEHFRLADDAWTEAGRTEPPRKVSGCFFVLGDHDEAAEATLQSFVRRYLNIFGEQVAEQMASTCRVASTDALKRVLDGAEAAGCDEFVLVPATTDLDCLTRTSALLT